MIVLEHKSCPSCGSLTCKHSARKRRRFVKSAVHDDLLTTCILDDAEEFATLEEAERARAELAGSGHSVEVLQLGGQRA